MISVGGAYRCKEWEATARLGLHSWHLSYLHKMKDLDLVAECEGNLMQVYMEWNVDSIGGIMSL